MLFVRALQQSPHGLASLPWLAAQCPGMSLDTIIHAGLSHSPRPTTALVLMGGGARTAYQVGVLRALGTLLRATPHAASQLPFRILVGTSAGAINAACLAACASQGLQAFDQLARFWHQLRSGDVYRLSVPSWARFSKVAAAYSLSRQARLRGAVLDNTPLVQTLTDAIVPGGIERALAMRAIDTLAVTASATPPACTGRSATPPRTRQARAGCGPGGVPTSSPSPSTT